MSADQYRFITRWRFQASPEAIFEIVSQPLDYPRWWPSVYLDVQAIGVDRVRLLTRGRLPYTLTWEARTIEMKPPHLLAIEASGDFTGRGIWSVVADTAVPGAGVTSVTFDWKVTVHKRLLAGLSFLFRPLFEANHEWAMEQGRLSLQRELLRRAKAVE